MDKLFSAEATAEKTHDGVKTFVRLTTYPGEGITRSKVVAYTDYVKALVGDVKCRAVETDLLPRDVLKVSISERERTYLLYIPPERRALLYAQRGRVKGDVVGFYVPYPSLILKVRVGEKIAKPEWVCALDSDKWPDSKTDIYHFPYSNVYTSGDICMGGNSIDIVGKSTAQILEECKDLFFMSPYNGDLFRLCENVKEGINFEQLLKKMNMKEKFPSEWLMWMGKLGDLK